MKHLFASGHTACVGCGEVLPVIMLLDTVGPNAIYVSATGCIEVFSSRYPESAWEVPWIHSLFENAAAVASGIATALKVSGRKDEAKVIALAGDGGTADIGLQALSGMFERGDDVLFVCFDNEAYMNTGIQRSGLTPLAAATTTSPAGKIWWGKMLKKKDVPAIAAAHNIPYVATASPGYYADLKNKVKKALSFTGPKYIQVLSPCPLGWRSDPAMTVEIAKLAVQSGIYPLYEIVTRSENQSGHRFSGVSEFRGNGELRVTIKVEKRKPVEEYLKLQGRFRHLFEKPEGKEIIAQIQEIADENAKKYGYGEVAK